MNTSASLALFAHEVSRPDHEMDLAQAALLIADAEYPDLDIAHYVSVLDEIGQGAQFLLKDRDKALDRLAAGQSVANLLNWMYGEIGFHGNDTDYYDPKNSYLNDVLDRKTGIPITLAVVLLEVCRRVGLSAYGISFPRHFLVSISTDLVKASAIDVVLLVDPFKGRIMARQDLRDLYAQVTGKAEDPEPQLLMPVSKRHILTRMLNNLRMIYEQRSDSRRLGNVLDRLQVLTLSSQTEGSRATSDHSLN